MNSFQFRLYQYRTKKEKSSFEKLLDDMIKKVGLYEKQYELTRKLYRLEWDKEITDYNNRREAALAISNQIYDEAYNEMREEDEQLRCSYASHISRIDELESELYEEKENIKDRYLDFFDLHCKSLIVSLYSLIESKLKDLCEISANEFDKKIKYSHLDTRDYIQSSINYFNLVIEMPTLSLESQLSKLKDIQFIRNRIVHSEGKFTDDNEKRIEEIIKKGKGELELLKNDCIMTLKIRKPEFIADFFGLIRELFEELIWLIDCQQNYKILKKGLEYWFGTLDKKNFIKNIKVVNAAKNKKNIEFDVSSRKKNIPKFKCRLSLVKSKENSLNIIDQTNNILIKNFTELADEMYELVFDYVFGSFNLSYKGLKLDLMIY